MTDLLSHGFTDVYRHFKPTEKDVYTFWTYFAGARAKNMGWRLDYFIVSNRILDSVKAYWRRPTIKSSEFVFPSHPHPSFHVFFKLPQPLSHWNPFKP